MVTVLVKFDYEARSSDELNLRKGDFINNVSQILTGGWWKGSLDGRTGMFPENFVTVLTDPDSLRLKATRSSSSNHRQENEDGVQNNVSQIAAKIGNKIDAPMRGDPTPKNRKKAKVVYSYTAQNDDEISLETGAIVIVDQLIEDGWYSGTCDGKKGCFPSNFIEFMKEDVEVEEKGQVQAKKVQGVGLGNIFDGQSMNLKTGDSGDAAVEPKSGKAKSSSSRKREEKALVTHDYTADADDELSLICGETIVILSRFAGDNGWWKGMVPSTRKVGVFPENFVKILPPDEQMENDRMYNDGAEYDNQKVKGKPLPPVNKSQQPLPSKKNNMEPHNRSSKVPNPSKSNVYPSPLPPKKHSKDPKSSVPAKREPDSHDEMPAYEYRSKEQYGSGSVSDQLLQMESSIMNSLTEEISAIRASVNQRIDSLTDELDEEKKVRVTMQVEIDRLRKLLRQ